VLIILVALSWNSRHHPPWWPPSNFRSWSTWIGPSCEPGRVVDSWYRATISN
jgi:hypothetical protein